MTKQALLLIFLLPAFSVFAQKVVPDQKPVEHAYESFKQTFEKEFEGEAVEAGKDEVISYHPAVNLPAWFVHFNASATPKLLSIGISDPGLDSLDALGQATMRALALASFSKKANIQNVSDNYYLDKDGSKTLGKFNSFTYYTTADTLGFNLLEYEFTSSGEMLVLIEVLDDAESPFFIHASLELFQSETSGKIISRLYFELDTQNPRGKNIKTTWLLKETPYSFEILSDWNGETIPFISAKYRYTSTSANHESSTAISEFRFDMKYGLWNAYLNALATNMEQMEVFNSQVKFLDDSYDKQFQDLTRIVFTEMISFEISDLKIDRNFLILDLVKE